MNMARTSDDRQSLFNDVKVGYRLPTLVRRPTTVQLFRYCGVTWNSHRIHFDKEYAASEGYPDVLVQSHLHGAFLTSLVSEFAGEESVIRRLYYSVRRFAIPGDVLHLDGVVTKVTERADETVFHLDIRETRPADGTTCAEGEAEVVSLGRTALGDRP